MTNPNRNWTCCKSSERREGCVSEYYHRPDNNRDFDRFVRRLSLQEKMKRSYTDRRMNYRSTILDLGITNCVLSAVHSSISIAISSRDIPFCVLWSAEDVLRVSTSTDNNSEGTSTPPVATHSIPNHHERFVPLNPFRRSHVHLCRRSFAILSPLTVVRVRPADFSWNRPKKTSREKKSSVELEQNFDENLVNHFESVVRRLFQLAVDRFDQRREVRRRCQTRCVVTVGDQIVLTENGVAKEMGHFGKTIDCRPTIVCALLKQFERVLTEWPSFRLTMRLRTSFVLSKRFNWSKTLVDAARFSFGKSSFTMYKRVSCSDLKDHWRSLKKIFSFYFSNLRCWANCCNSVLLPPCIKWKAGRVVPSFRMKTMCAKPCNMWWRRTLRKSFKLKW